jgi:hypothetical protein
MTVTPRNLDQVTGVIRDCRDMGFRMFSFQPAAFGGMDFQTPPALLAARTARAVARHPRVLPSAAAWARRAIVRAGGLRALRRTPPRPMTFVMHAFMDTRVVRPAWAALQRGEAATDPEVREAQERLQACSYAMAHPEDGSLVPACAQHAVLDPAENARLAALLPLHSGPRRDAQSST